MSKLTEAARKIIVDNLAADEIRPHKTLVGMMAILLVLETGSDPEEAKKAILEEIEAVAGQRTAEQFSAPACSGFIQFDQSVRFTKEDWEKWKKAINGQNFVTLADAEQRDCVTLGDISRRIIDLEAALSALLERHVRLVQKGWNVEAEVEVIIARRLLEMSRSSAAIRNGYPGRKEESMRKTNSNGTLNAHIVEPGEVQPDDRYGYKIVAVIYSKSFWAAYKCFTDWTDEHVAENGDKISHEVAAMLFPSIDAAIPNYND